MLMMCILGVAVVEAGFPEVPACGAACDGAAGDGVAGDGVAVAGFAGAAAGAAVVAAVVAVFVPVFPALVTCGGAGAAVLATPAL